MEIQAAAAGRIQDFSYTLKKEDHPRLDRAILQAEAILKAETNQQELPQGLFFVWADVAAGLFLQEMKALGALDKILKLEPEAKSITEGDTSVTFNLSAAGTREDQFDSAVARLVTPNEALMAAFRKLQW